MKNYVVVYTDEAVKSIRKIDKIHQTRLKNWIEKNLIGCSNPYFSGKALKGNKKGFWRYRVGSYRIVAKINEYEIIIEIIKIGHRQGVYKN